jgi:hypothetical protein
MDYVPTSLFIFQCINLVLFIISLMFGIMAVIKNKELRAYVIPLLTYILHVIAFYCFVVATNINGTNQIYSDIINGWSAGIRLHLALLSLAEFSIILFGGKKWLHR